MKRERQRRALVVDPELRDRQTAMQILRQDFGCHIEQAKSYVEAMAAFAGTTFDIVVVDVNLNGDQTGLNLLDEIRKLPEYIPVMLTATMPTQNTVNQALRLGVDVFLRKKYSPRSFILRAKNIFEGNGQPAIARLSLGKRRKFLQTQAVLMNTFTLISQPEGILPVELLQSNARSMLDAIHDPDIRRALTSLEGRNGWIYPHLLLVGAHLTAQATHKKGYSPDDVLNIGTGGFVHDVGELKVNADILNKEGQLTPVEHRQIETHVIWGQHMLNNNTKNNDPTPWQWLTVMSEHHERLDGSGYPLGLQGEQISLEGRMAAIADVFSAMTMERPYRRATSRRDALAYLGTERKKFDQNLVRQFVAIMDKPELRDLVQN